MGGAIPIYEWITRWDDRRSIEISLIPLKWLLSGISLFFHTLFPVPIHSLYLRSFVKLSSIHWHAYQSGGTSLRTRRKGRREQGRLDWGRQRDNHSLFLPCMNANDAITLLQLMFSLRSTFDCPIGAIQYDSGLRLLPTPCEWLTWPIEREHSSSLLKCSQTREMVRVSGRSSNLLVTIPLSKTVPFASLSSSFSSARRGWGDRERDGEWDG